MDEMIYHLFLRSRSGWTLFGVLRYQLTDAEPQRAADVANLAPPPWQPLHCQQPEPPVEVDAWPLRGTVHIPFLTGWQAVPLAGTAYLVLPDRPLVTFAYGIDAPIEFSFNQFHRQRIGGGMRWQPTGTAFGLLGRQVMLPA